MRPAGRRSSVSDRRGAARRRRSRGARPDHACARDTRCPPAPSRLGALTGWPAADAVGRRPAREREPHPHPAGLAAAPARSRMAASAARPARRTSRCRPTCAGRRPPSRSWCARSGPHVDRLPVGPTESPADSAVVEPALAVEHADAVPRGKRRRCAERRPGRARTARPRSEARRRCPSGGITTPSRPLPMNGDGERCGIVGGEEKVESWAPLDSSGERLRSRERSARAHGD